MNVPRNICSGSLSQSIKPWTLHDPELVKHLTNHRVSSQKAPPVPHTSRLRRQPKDKCVSLLPEERALYKAMDESDRTTPRSREALYRVNSEDWT